MKIRQQIAVETKAFGIYAMHSVGRKAEIVFRVNELPEDRLDGSVEVRPLVEVRLELEGVTVPELLKTLVDLGEDAKGELSKYAALKGHIYCFAHANIGGGAV